MQGETNRLPRHAPASVLAPTISHIAASATVSTSADDTEKHQVQRRAEAEGGDGVDAEREGVAPPAEVNGTPARQ